MPDDRRIIWEVTDYGSLLDGLRARLKELDVATATVEGVTGLTHGYVSKILRHRSGRLPLSRMRPFTVGILLQGLAVKLLMVEDARELERIKGRLQRRGKSGPRVGEIKPRDACATMLAREHKQNPSHSQWKGNTEWAQNMALRRATLLRPAYLKRIASKAAHQRWKASKKSRS
jgi:hypothetical protein